MTLYEENVLAVVRWCWTRGYRLPEDLAAVPAELHGFSRCVLRDAQERLEKIPPLRTSRPRLRPRIALSSGGMRPRAL